MNFNKELNIALLSNLKFKAQILTALFALIFIIQIIILSYFYFNTELFVNTISIKMVFIGPLLIFSACFAELYAIKRFNKFIQVGKEISPSFEYIMTFVEVSFPSFILLFAWSLMAKSEIVNASQLLSSPPSYIYFIMILLSSLMLDFNISLFAGHVSALQFIGVAIYIFSSQTVVSPTDYPNNLMKGFLFAVTGAIAGFVSKKIKEAVISSLLSKDDLINRLDILVNEKTHEINLQKEEIIEKNKDINDSINYARRIQNAILPKPEFIDKMFEEYFVLYHPKDVVSGDFYWAAEKGNRKIIAAIDCTGHGVPGAFMSMVGSALLNEIVNEKNITQSGEILNQLRNRLVSTLQQTGEVGESKDGMDIALLTIEGNELEFSGANNPLYFVRRNHLQELKGDKHPIGIHMGNKHHFSTQTLKLEKGDSIYIFTDGYADQFGGQNNKKFMYKKLQEKILQIVHQDMKQQKETLYNCFIEWKGVFDQIDDVLIIGIRYE